MGMGTKHVGSSNKIVTLPPAQYGWIQGDGSYSIQYDSDEPVLIIRQRVSKFTQGCKCKGGCKHKDVDVKRMDSNVVQGVDI